MTGHAFEAEDIASSSRLGGNSRAIHALSNKLEFVLRISALLSK